MKDIRSSIFYDIIYKLFFKLMSNNNISKKPIVMTEKIKPRYTWLIDPGHGGVIDGKYQTSTKWWKRSFFKDLYPQDRGRVYAGLVSRLFM